MNVKLNKLLLLYDNYITSGLAFSELDSKKLRQIRLINLTTLLLCLAVTVFIVASYQLSISYIKPILGISLPIALSIVLLLRFTHNIKLCGHLTLINLCVTIFVGNFFIGGPLSPAILWILIIPIVAVVIVDNALMLYLTISLLMTVSLYILSYFNTIPVSPIASNKVFLLEFISFVTELFIFTLCLHSLLQEKNNYELFLENANRHLNIEKDKYHFMAHHDNLTNLANRTQFDRAIIQAFDNRSKNSKITIFYIDVDKMKEINDNYGHDVGDRVLAFVGQRLKQSFRQNDLVARIGGDEFAAVIIVKAGSKTPQIIAKRILQYSKNLIKVGDLKIPLTMSIGIACYPDDGLNMDEVIKKADEALYLVKKSGRNNYAIYNKSFDYR